MTDDEIADALADRFLTMAKGKAWGLDLATLADGEKTKTSVERTYISEMGHRSLSPSASAAEEEKRSKKGGGPRATGGARPYPRGG